jgi:uncharacterized membrane protein YfcA
MLTAWILYIATGAFAGVLAGLLGVGGGIVIVPILNALFHMLALPEQYIQHLALGTSLATIMFTSVSSLRAHHKRGAVIWRIVLTITPGILIGTFVGSLFAAHLSKRFLTGFFVAFLYYVASQMLLNIKPKPTRQIPGLTGMFGAGGVIGAVSSLVGIGGGTLSVPFMTWCNVPLHTCIGTSAAIGFPIAVAGTAGYIIAGQSAALPGFSGGYLGFIYLPALIGVAGMSIVTAPLGAKLAHSLPTGKLKKIFACLLIVVATRMLWAVVAPYLG